MQPLADFPQNALRKIRFVLTDIDDTLTEKGRLPAASYLALERLQQFGIKVIPITGRPAGWCDHIARMWGRLMASLVKTVPFTLFMIPADEK